MPSGGQENRGGRSRHRACSEDPGWGRSRGAGIKRENLSEATPAKWQADKTRLVFEPWVGTVKVATER